MMKRWLAFFVIVCLIIAFQSSCSKNNRYDIFNMQNANMKAKDVTIRFISPWIGTDAKTATLNRVLSQFMQENPNIHIMNESMSDSDFLIKLKTDFASGNAPDVFLLWYGSNMMSFIEQGKIADLTQLLNNDKAWKNSFSKEALGYLTINEHIYGVPLEILYNCLFVNNDIFERCNVPIPQNFEQLKYAVEIFNKNNIIPIAYNAQSEGNLLYQGIVASLTGKLNVANPISDYSENYKKGMDYLKQLYDLEAFPKDAFRLSDNEMNNLFLDKSAAMIFQSSTFIGKVTQRLSNDNDVNRTNINTDNYREQLLVDMYNFPTIDGGSADATALIYGVGSGTFFMSESADSDPQKKDACVKLLKFLTSTQSATEFAKKSYMQVSIKIPPPDVYYGGLMRRGRELIDSSKELILPPDIILDKSIWNSVVIGNIPYVLEGKQQPQDIWEQVFKRQGE